MPARWPLLGLVLVLGAVLVWWLTTGDDSSRAPWRADRKPASAESATLQGLTPPVDAASSPKARPVPIPVADGRRWLLDVQCVQPKGRYGGADWSPGGTADPAFRDEAVRVELWRGQEHRVLARGALDGRGMAHFELPALGMLDRLTRVASTLHVLPEKDTLLRAPRLTHYFVSKGAQGHSYQLPAELPEGDVMMRLVVQAYAGDLVRGRVVGADREPAANVHVACYGTNGSAATSTCTDEQGGFAIRVWVGGTFSLHATARSGASCSRTDLALPADRAIELGTLQLKEGEEFSGRVSYPDGSPVVGLPVLASHHFANMHLSYGPPTLACQGAADDHLARTTAEGRFRIFHGGLVGGNNIWSIMAWHDGGGRVDFVDPQVRFPTKSRKDIDGVMRGHAVLFRVLDEDGRPIPRARLTLKRTAQDRERPGKSALRLTSGEDGTVREWLSRGSTWTAVAVLAGAAAGTAEFRVPTRENESEVDLTVRSPDSKTGLTLALTDSEGHSLTPFMLKVRTKGGVQLWHGRVDTKESVPLLLHPGGYRTVVSAIEAAPWLGSEQRWLPVTEHVVVQAGRITRVRTSTTEACHLGVLLQLEPGLDKRLTPHHPRVHLEHAETGRKLREFVNSRYRGGSSVLDVELEPGLWTVRFEAADFRSVTRKITLERGQIGRLEFVMERDGD